MGEIFDRPAPSQELEWTGERLTSAVSGQIEIEHLHRYFFARTFCRGLDVLDVASGEGYGSSLLSQVARSVVGVEIDPAAVTHAARAYSKPNLAYVNGDARAIPLPDASVDVVVSFETLEHFFEHDAFLREVKRVLRPGGRFVISSPDRDVYSPLGSSANPYHVNELTRHEFERLLAGHFRHCAMFLQRPVLGSVLFPEDRAQGVLTFERRGENHYEASLGIPRAPYNVVVASDATLDEAHASVFFETSAIGEVLSQVEARAIDLASFAREREQYEGLLHGTRGELQSAEEGTRSALARAERAEEALHLLTSTRSVEVDDLAAGLREELRALFIALEQNVARATSAEQALATSQASERLMREQSDQLIASLREELRQADEAMKGQLSRMADLHQELASGRLQAEQVIASLHEDLHQADEAMKGQLSRMADLDRELASGQLQAEQVIASLREELRQADEAMRGQLSRTADIERDLSAAGAAYQATQQDLETARTELAYALEAARLADLDKDALQLQLAEGTSELEQSRSALIAASERAVALEGELALVLAELASRTDVADPSEADQKSCGAASAAPSGNKPVDTVDQAELVLLRDTVKALQAQLATLQAQKDAAGLSLRIQSSLMQKLRAARVEDDQCAVANDVYADEIDAVRQENEQLRVEMEAWRSLFEHTRASVEGVLRISGARIMPKSTRTWLRRKIYGPRWIR